VAIAASVTEILQQMLWVLRTPGQVFLSTPYVQHPVVGRLRSRELMWH